MRRAGGETNRGWERREEVLLVSLGADQRTVDLHCQQYEQHRQLSALPRCQTVTSKYFTTPWTNHYMTQHLLQLLPVSLSTYSDVMAFKQLIARGVIPNCCILVCLLPPLSLSQPSLPIFPELLKVQLSAPSSSCCGRHCERWRRSEEELHCISSTFTSGPL